MHVIDNIVKSNGHNIVPWSTPLGTSVSVNMNYQLLFVCDSTERFHFITFSKLGFCKKKEGK